MLLKKTLVWILVFCMITSGISSAAWAEENPETGEVPAETVSEQTDGSGDGTDEPGEEENIPPEETVPTEPDENAAGDENGEQTDPEITGNEPGEENPAGETIVPEPAVPEETIETEEIEKTEETEETEETEPEKENEAPERMSAAADGAEYVTLQEAVDAVGSGDVYLLEFAQEDVTVRKDQQIVFHLNGGFYSGRIVNYGELTITADGGEGWLDGEVSTGAFHIRDENGDTVDFASGSTGIESGTITGTLSVEQDTGARLSDGDPLPALSVTGGNLTGADFAEYYTDPDTNEREAAEGVGTISVTGGVFAESPENYLAEGYDAVYSEGVFYVGPRQAPEGETEPGMQEDGAEAEQSGADADTYVQPVFTDGTNASGGTTDGVLTGADGQKNAEQEQKEESREPEKQEPEKEVLDVDLFMYGSGSFLYEGEKYTSNDTIQVESGEEPEITILPDEGLEVRSVTVGTNGLATAYGAVEEIQLEPVMMYTTVTAMLGSTPKYTVTYNYGNGTASKSEEMEACEISLEEAPERSGYQFRGWQSSLDGQVYEAGKTYSVSADVTFTALWHQLSTFTVQYVLDGGSNSEQNPVSYTEGSAAAALEDAVKTGYSFEGWYTDPAFTSRITELSDETVQGNLTLYAKFEVIQYTITYHLDGGTNDASNPETYTVHETVSFADPVKQGYTFDGWYRDDSFGEKTTGISEGSTGNIDVYAKFTPIPYTITCMADGEQYSVISYTVEDAVISLPDAVKEGYAFKGWYTDPAFSGGSQISSVDPSSLPGNIVVYARLVPQYAITYVLNGGKLPSAASNPTYYTSEDSTIVYPTPYREDYIFEGWYTTADMTGAPVVSLPGGSAGNVSLYAKWEKIPVFYKVYVYYNTFGSVSSGGSVIPARSYFELEEGKSATLYFNPASSSYYVYNCTVNGEKQGSVSSYTIKSIGSDIIVSVTFVPTIARPMTGDSSRIGMWACLMAVSGLASAVLLNNRRRRKEK